MPPWHGGEDEVILTGKRQAGSEIVQAVVPMLGWVASRKRSVMSSMSRSATSRLPCSTTYSQMASKSAVAASETR